MCEDVLVLWVPSSKTRSSHNDQKHTDIVWETRWVDQGPDKQPGPWEPIWGGNRPIVETVEAVVVASNHLKVE